ncbi:MAG: hypothetical protein ACE5NG_01570 [bacterium]
MAAEKTRFRRKLSAEEAGENYIMIQKKELDFFPKVGRPFKLKVSDKEFDTYVQAVECWCRGPDKPHSHYRIDVSPFKDLVEMHWGTKIIIEKIKDARYRLVS